ncbi:MAG: hypothetical protein JWM80_2941 [Cyanobacteria bacterium RYN_339]|nr:hypothetical protein [Cyanobacteria bacterium RYN_339]
MDDSTDASLDLLVTAADLRLSNEEVIATLERLARMFELALPEHAAITRGGWIFSKEKPVASLALDFGDVGFELAREGKVHVRATVQKRVRGVVLKTDEIPLDDWTARVAAELNRLAGQNARARAALHQLTQG